MEKITNLQKEYYNSDTNIIICNTNIHKALLNIMKTVYLF